MSDDVPTEKMNLDPFTDKGQVVREYVDELRTLGESLDTLVKNLTTQRERIEKSGEIAKGICDHLCMSSSVIVHGVNR